MSRIFRDYNLDWFGMSKYVKHLSGCLALVVLFFFPIPSVIAKDMNANSCPIQTNHQLIAAWYGWWGRPETSGEWVHWRKVNEKNHNIADTQYYPENGPYDSHDPLILAQQIELAKSSGITAFAASWWGPKDFSDTSLKDLLVIAERACIRVAAYYETIRPVSGQTPVDAAAGDLLYLLEHYTDSPVWLRWRNKPVIFVYGRALGEISKENWNEVASKIEAKHPGGVALIADISESYKHKLQHDSLRPAKVFGGVHVYNITKEIQGMTPGAIAAWGRTDYTQIVASTLPGEPSITTIIPGYNDSKASTSKLARPITERFNGETYKALWGAAIEANPDWLLLTSWNEWHEGTQIEPSYEFGELYTDLTKQYSKIFLSQPPSSRGNALIRSLYSCVLERAPNNDELAHDLSNLSVSFGSPFRKVFRSSEYVGKLPSDEQYIERLYRCIFLRSPDGRGLAGYLAALSHGKPRDAILEDFLNSAEFKNRWVIASDAETGSRVH